jgi:hypothetical protein
VTVAAGFGIEVQPAIASEAGTKLNLDGLRPCACAVWLTGSSVDTRPKAAMTVERIGSFIAVCFSLPAVEG